MATVQEQKDAALERLELLVQPTVEPVIADLEAILDRHQRASIWAIATAYEYGDVILPTVRNGHSYRCIQAGTSEADADDEPDWPLASAATITEGVSDPILIWEEMGPDFDNVWDVRGAAHEAWMAKATQAVLNVDASGPVGNLKASQIYDHCVAMAEKYAALEIA